MTVQNETAWLLDIIKSNWPDTWPDNLVRRNRDDSVTLDVPDAPLKEMGVSLDRYISIGVSEGSQTREVYGQTPQYRVETVLDVRIEAKYDEEWGEIGDIDGFNQLVNYCKYAINREITYPNVPASDPIGQVQYLDLRIEDENSLSSGDKDYYRTDLSVRLVGHEDPRKGNSSTAFPLVFEAPFTG